MPVLHNRVSNKELRQRMLAETDPRITISFYCYHPIAQPQELRNQLWTDLTALQVFGRIYVAHEGINAQISVPSQNYQSFEAYINGVDWLRGVRLNQAVDDDGKSFWVLSIKVREKIVADGITDPSFDVTKTGKYLKAKEFNALASDPNTVVLDMRNHYEYEVGHFKNAIEVPSDTFRDQLPMAVNMMKEHQDKNIVMYCTGGIRCEKASAYMLHHGFKNVFHIEGGIINYVNQVKEQGLEQQFVGKNFVFDNRLGERITPEIIARCHQCGAPADTHVNCANEACHLLFIQCSKCAAQYDGCCSETCCNVYRLPTDTQKLLRKGVVKDGNVFNKSRSRLSVKPPQA
ncbi:MAG: rhodanese-related sulfurtransferase [Bacteroidetes bacterium]|nr:MAG: rhodanese-related sulfurtransferase [Bacteroidota bacterium]